MCAFEILSYVNMCKDIKEVSYKLKKLWVFPILPQVYYQQKIMHKKYFAQLKYHAFRSKTIFLVLYFISTLYNLNHKVPYNSQNNKIILSFLQVRNKPKNNWLSNTLTPIFLPSSSSMTITIYHPPSLSSLVSKMSTSLTAQIILFPRLKDLPKDSSDTAMLFVGGNVRFWEIRAQIQV